MGSYTADADLRLGCPQSDILERISWVLIYRPREDGQLSWLVATTGFEPGTFRGP